MMNLGKRLRIRYNFCELKEHFHLNSPLAVTKIVLPSRRGALLSRSRLVDFLHQNIERKLILVSASAGYGKSSLLIDFAHDTLLPVCWYSLDANDNDPKVFLEYVIASLQQKFPEFGSRTLHVLAESGLDRDLDMIVGALVTEIHEEISGYFVLVLDDYQLVEESEGVNRILDSLLRLLPENAHIILSGRILPTHLTLTRLAARQEIAGLGMNDLKFSPGEIRALVKQNYDADLSEQDAEELADKAEGWITGILLTTQSLWKGLLQDLVRVPGSQGQLFNYLASEVLTQQSEELQNFLLGSSVLSQLNAENCNQLLGIQDAGLFLTQLEQRNLFITRISEDESWYRYHHLFQEFLETRLREGDQARWQALHRQAAELFIAQHEWDQAISHCLKIELFDKVAQVVEQIAKETFDAGHWATLAKWIDALPEQVFGKNPELINWRGRIFRETGETDQALRLYKHALDHYEKLGDQDGIGKTLVMQAICLRFQGNYQQSIQSCEHALTFLSQDAVKVTSEAHRTIGISNALLGDWQKCIDELQSALSFYDQDIDHTVIALIHQDLGVALRTLGDRNAQTHFQAALEHWQLANNSIGLANTLNSIGISYHRQGEYVQATETFLRARSEAHKSGHLRIEALILASLGDVYRDQAAHSQAEDAYRSAYEIGRRINEGFIITYTLCALGELLSIAGDSDTADELLSTALKQAENHHSNYEMGLAKTALGISNYGKGNLIDAENELNSAVKLLEQGGAKRDSARAYLHLARANLLRRNYVKANKNLRVTASLGMQLQEDQFVVGDRQRVIPLLKYAVSKKIGNGYFARALKKIQVLPKKERAEEKQRGIIIPAIKAYAFGTARVHLGGEQITNKDWGSSSAKELFFLLLANPQGLRKEEILEKLWQDISAPKASAIFHSTSHRARHAFSFDCIVYSDGVYTLSRDINLWDDISQFNHLIDRALNSDLEHERALHYQKAITLYQGDYFEDSYNDWCVPMRAMLQSKYLDALRALANYQYQNSQYQDALGLYRKILSKDPLREEIYREMMAIQAKMGDRSGALKTYEQCLHILKDELNLVPSEETRVLHQQILEGVDIS